MPRSPRQCPTCDEVVPRRARFCPFCAEELEEAASGEATPEYLTREEADRLIEERLERERKRNKGGLFSDGD